jgi:hypothetical protein
VRQCSIVIEFSSFRNSIQFKTSIAGDTAKKPAATYSRLGVAAGSMKAFCTGFLGLQHFTPNLRLPASPIGKEAVGKSEVIKSVRAVHCVSGRFRHQFIEASGYYRQESEKLSRQN